MYENVHPNLTPELLFIRTDAECGKGPFILFHICGIKIWDGLLFWRVCLSMGIWFSPTTVLLAIFEKKFSTVYVSISSFVPVMYGYELWLKIKDSQWGAPHQVGYNHVISNKCEWSNCFIKKVPKM